MIRILLLSVLILVGGTLAHAQSTNPCPTGYTFSPTEGVCNQNPGTSANGVTCTDPNHCTTEDIVVTAPSSPTSPTAPAPVATGPSFKMIVDKIVGIVNGSVLPLMYALAFVYFLLGLSRFFLGSEAERAKGRKMMFWGTLGLGILFSIWGILNLTIATLTSFSAGG